MKAKFFTLFFIILCAVSAVCAQRKFVHPGLTYTQADLDRMKAMVAAKQEPFYSTFTTLVQSEYSQIGNGNYGEVTQIKEGEFNGTIGRDGRRAHDLALLYHITGDRAYADDAVTRLNRYKNLTNASARGTAALDNGKLYLLLEAAELLRDYDGWAATDQEAFKNMLVYPFYSTTVDASSTHKHWTDDSQNNVTFYWNIYNFDAARWGNQGLFAARSLLAMGVYLDNDTIYDRAARYLAALPAREDDLPYGGLPIQGSLKSNNGRFKEYNISWSRPETISDEALKYYIYENGQCQEACRDQSHVLAGIGNYTAIAEIAWNQGDPMYSWLDNRILKGIEYGFRYNMSFVNTYPEQSQPWEPTGSSAVETDCTYDNGVFYQALSRSRRWEAVAISPDGRGASPEGWVTQALQHYKIRAGLSADNYKWLQRSYDELVATAGIEDWGIPPNWYYEWTGWGTLTKYRTEWMAGNPGIWENSLWKPGMPTAPATINAVDYDHFNKDDGEGRTFHNVGATRSTLYRTDGTVEIEKTGNNYILTGFENGEWLNYTFAIPVAGNYDVYVTYQATAQASVSIAVDNGTELSNNLPALAAFGETKIGGLNFAAGASVLRLKIVNAGTDLKIKNIRLAYAPDGTKKVAFEGKLTSSNTFVMQWNLENILAEEINLLRSVTNDINSAETISANNLFGEFTDRTISGAIPKYYYWVAYKENNLVSYSDPISFEWGYLYDDFKDTDTDNALWTVAGQGAGVVENEYLNISYTDSKAYFRRTESFSFHGGNFPILAFSLEKPENSTIALHSSATRKFGGDVDQYTGKIGDNVYYYDLTTDLFKTNVNATSGDRVPVDSIQTINPVQIRQTVAVNTDAPSKLHWIGTFRNMNELNLFIETNSSDTNIPQNHFMYFVDGKSVHFTNMIDNATLYVYTTSGQLVTIKPDASPTMTVTLPEKGIYLFVVKTMEQIHTIKIII